MGLLDLISVHIQAVVSTVVCQNRPYGGLSGFWSAPLEVPESTQPCLHP